VKREGSELSEPFFIEIGGENYQKSSLNQIIFNSLAELWHLNLCFVTLA
jgi:hypothetical protein